MIGGAAGGAVCSAITGGDIGMGALTGVVAAVISFGVGRLHIAIRGGNSAGNWLDDLAGFASSAKR